MRQGEAVFVDSGAWIALALSRDTLHAHAREQWNLLQGAGATATGAAPLAWLRMEPAGDHADIHLTMWPGGEDRLMARSGYHGANVQWLG